MTEVVVPEKASQQIVAPENVDAPENASQTSDASVSDVESSVSSSEKAAAPTWVEWIKERPIPVAVGGAIALALAAYSTFVKNSGPIEGAKKYDEWQRKQMQKDDVDEIEDSADILESLIAGPVPDMSKIRRAREKLRQAIASRPPPSANQFTVIVKAINDEGNYVAVMPNKSSRMPRAIRDTWKIVAKAFNVKSRGLDVRVKPALKGALSYATVDIPFGRSNEDSIEEMRKELLRRNIIKRAQPTINGTKGHWIQWDPVVDAKNIIRPTITIHVLVPTQYM